MIRQDAQIAFFFSPQLIIDWHSSGQLLAPFTPPGAHYAKITFYFIITNRGVNN